MAATFAIAHVTPYPWEVENEVNRARGASRRRSSRDGGTACWCSPLALAGAGARVAQAAARRAGRPRARCSTGPTAARPRVIAVGEVLEVAPGARRRAPALPIDVARTVEEVLTRVPLDFVHVHEPFAPSTSNAALRHSRSLNVGSFHSSSERLLSTLLARRFVESFFGRLDARTATLPATVELMGRAFPADYELVADDEQAAERFEQIYRAWRRAATAPGDPELARAARRAPADRGRPAHAHRPLLRLRDPGRGAAGERPRRGPRARSR